MNRRRPSRAASVALTLLLGVGVLAGCAPADPAPDPTPTGFASEAEAFAAAEATYRAYVDALNQVDLADPATFEEVYRWTTGDANAGARESFSEFHADGYVVSGESRVLSVQPASDQQDGADVLLDVCLDVSGVHVTDASGNVVTSQDRSDVQTLRVQTKPESDSSTGMRVSGVFGRDDGVTCD